MTFPSAKIVAHSKAPNGEELITMEIELHRFILPEFNTHRCFSRNFQSSRAVPVNKMIDQVKNDPAIPLYWGKNQRGMVAEEEWNEEVNVLDLQIGEVFPTDKESAWRAAAYDCAEIAINFEQAGYHKQIVNRLLEPFMKTKGVVTATREGFESFFKLRSHKDAQPEIKALSDRMMTVLEKSVPNKLSVGDYHLPYIGIPYDNNGVDYIAEKIENSLVHHKDCSSETLRNDIFQINTKDLLRVNNMSIAEAVKVSSSCCAQVSYRSLNDSLGKAVKIYKMLNLPEKGVYPEDPPHFSPTEHVAVVTNEYDMAEERGIIDDEYLRYSGNFNSKAFGQYRKFLEDGSEDVFEMITD